jgi:signal transduction histidine kinase
MNSVVEVALEDTSVAARRRAFVPGGWCGTGLGLYVCSHLDVEMGGGICVTDNQPRGSTFAFEIPASQGGAR